MHTIEALDVNVNISAFLNGFGIAFPAFSY